MAEWPDSSFSSLDVMRLSGQLRRDAERQGRSTADTAYLLVAAACLTVEATGAVGTSTDERRDAVLALVTDLFKPGGLVQELRGGERVTPTERT